MQHGLGKKEEKINIISACQVISFSQFYFIYPLFNQESPIEIQHLFCPRVKVAAEKKKEITNNIAKIYQKYKQDKNIQKYGAENSWQNINY